MTSCRWRRLAAAARRARNVLQVVAVVVVAVRGVAAGGKVLRVVFAPTRNVRPAGGRTSLCAAAPLPLHRHKTTSRPLQSLPLHPTQAAVRSHPGSSVFPFSLGHSTARQGRNWSLPTTTHAPSLYIAMLETQGCPWYLLSTTQ